MTIKIRAETDLYHSWFDIWGRTEAFVTWQGQFSLLLVRTMIRSRRINIDIMELPGEDELGLHRFFAIRFQKRMIQSVHNGQYVIVRVG